MTFTFGGSPIPVKNGWPEFGGEVPIQEMPMQSSHDRVHVLDVDCWCKPVIETRPLRIVHSATDPKAEPDDYQPADDEIDPQLNDTPPLAPTFPDDDAIDPPSEDDATTSSEVPTT